jgi:hypothetical protein
LIGQGPASSWRHAGTEGGMSTGRGHDRETTDSRRRITRNKVERDGSKTKQNRKRVTARSWTEKRQETVRDTNTDRQPKKTFTTVIRTLDMT